MNKICVAQIRYFDLIDLNENDGLVSDSRIHMLSNQLCIII